MQIKQFEDKNLSHYSYAIVSQGKMALIDPSRDPKPYYDFAAEHKAEIVAIIETHPHADFVSSHLEIHQKTGSPIYVSRLLQADYPHKSFDDGQEIKVGSATLRALNTPGHSPDSICIVLRDEDGIDRAVFTGDTLFIGDCGRPDLRESTGTVTATRHELAKHMYQSLRVKLMTLPDEILIYPAHGAGSLCGKGLSAQNSSTLGAEKISNWSLQRMDEREFIEKLLADQPFVPKYFPYDVAINKKGAAAFKESIEKVPRRLPVTCSGCVKSIDEKTLVVDTRPEKTYKQSHLKNSINLMEGGKFETWLGSIVNPEEPFYLAAADEAALERLIARCASIGYESQIKMAFVLAYGTETSPEFKSSDLRGNETQYTILDIRNNSELKAGKIFDNALHIPLPELRERLNEVPTDKPIVVHCAAGYRSAAGSSILENQLNKEVMIFDLSEGVKEFFK